MHVCSGSYATKFMYRSKVTFVQKIKLPPGFSGDIPVECCARLVKATPTESFSVSRNRETLSRLSTIYLPPHKTEESSIFR